MSTEAWDVVVVDNLAVAGVVEDLPTRDRQGVPVAYVSHNHETSLRESLAARVSPWSPWRLIQALDAKKAASIEAELVRRARLITATSAEDIAEFRRDAPHASLVELRPGFGGRRVEHRTIDERVPRRVLVLGSFNWIAKQMNLKAFLGSAYGRLSEAQIGIDIVGDIPPRLAKEIQRRYPRVRVHGRVDSVDQHLERARIGIVAEEIGGGFKPNRSTTSSAESRSLRWLGASTGCRSPTARASS